MKDHGDEEGQDDDHQDRGHHHDDGQHDAMCEDQHTGLSGTMRGRRVVDRPLSRNSGTARRVSAEQRVTFWNVRVEGVEHGRLLLDRHAGFRGWFQGSNVGHTYIPFMEYPLTCSGSVQVWFHTWQLGSMIFQYIPPAPQTSHSTDLQNHTGRAYRPEPMEGLDPDPLEGSGGSNMIKSLLRLQWFQRFDGTIPKFDGLDGRPSNYIRTSSGASTIEPLKTL